MLAKCCDAVAVIRRGMEAVLKRTKPITSFGGSEYAEAISPIRAKIDLQQARRP